MYSFTDILNWAGCINWSVYRELAVRRTLDDHPFLWDLLSYICTYKPCFVTISLFIRCHLATLCTSWGKALEGRAKAMPKEMQATEKVMSFLVKVSVWWVGEWVSCKWYKSSGFWTTGHLRAQAQGKQFFSSLIIWCWVFCNLQLKPWNLVKIFGSSSSSFSLMSGVSIKGCDCAWLEG